ncbi:hypothetical protein [Peribacillus huizhouensis]|uniref:Uncharacterized protein n=1 Tax=Peribacillus huizhouensis TaxID=1501239 RepID=A0ABR6CSC6_9BACI|nr:hypothetical protein [Peribacillus huizhouensis]MBA9027932.1 hypothetical protein [Peribacillus huizhouensis]
MNSGFYDEDIHFPKLSKTLTDKLVAKKRVNPHIQVIFITDEVNTTYQSYQLKELKKMRENGIEVIVANLDRLRDPNPIYSGFYRTFLQWFSESGYGWIWNNKDGIYMVDYEEYQDKLPVFKYITYRIQKIFKFTTY